MKNIKALVAVLSWEERFIEGMKLNLEQYLPESLLLFMFDGYHDRNAGNLSSLDKLCKEHNITVVKSNLNFSYPKENWFTIREMLYSNVTIHKSVLVDITTMPREVIWQSLFFLEQRNASIDYVYHRPFSYNNNWLSRDSGEPRLIYKLSGISEILKPTTLIVFPGYDFQRVSKIVEFFEPQKLVIGCQSREDESNRKIAEKCISEYSGDLECEIINYEAFGDSHGYEEISTLVANHLDGYNIVLSSLGAKLSAISLYKVCRAFPEVALSYIPCKEFNTDYSKGILRSSSIYRTLKIPKRKHELNLEN